MIGRRSGLKKQNCATFVAQFCFRTSPAEWSILKGVTRIRSLILAVHELMAAADALDLNQNIANPDHDTEDKARECIH